MVVEEPAEGQDSDNKIYTTRKKPLVHRLKGF